MPASFADDEKTLRTYPPTYIEKRKQDKVPKTENKTFLIISK